MPWHWDYDSYDPDDPEKAKMIGFFYPEDVATIRTLQKWLVEKQNREYEEAKTKARQGSGQDNPNQTGYIPRWESNQKFNSGKSFDPAMFESGGWMK